MFGLRACAFFNHTAPESHGYHCAHCAILWNDLDGFLSHVFQLCASNYRILRWGRGGLKNVHTVRLREQNGLDNRLKLLAFIASPHSEKDPTPQLLIAIAVVAASAVQYNLKLEDVSRDGDM
eukprot:1146373-Amphidinium_carterae.1